MRASAPPGGDGLTWATALNELRGEALRYAASAASGVRPVQVWVATGTYKPYGPVSGPDDPGREASFELVNNVELYGGFAGAETDLSQRTIPILPERETILSGDLNGDDEEMGGTNAENSYRVVRCANAGASARLDGFIVERGTNTSWSGDLKGAGVYVADASPVICNCTIRWNDAGGYIYGGWGIGMAIEGASSAQVVNCAFYENRGPGGPGLNVTTTSGNPWVVNCVFSGNQGRYGRALIVSAGHVVNCTFAGNLGDEGYTISGSDCSVANCIVWGNDDSWGHVSLTNSEVSYSCIEGGYSGPGEGIIAEDPQFTDLSSRNLRLSLDSPCIDAGNDLEVPVWVTTDIEGIPRFVDGDGDTVLTVDLGAYEYHGYCENCPGTRVWLDPLGGFFSDHDNWSISAPDQRYAALFALDASYAVSFDQDAQVERLLFWLGDVTFDFGAGPFRECDVVSTSPSGALVLGERSDDSTSLAVVGNGQLDTMFGSVAFIGSAPDSNGHLEVSGPDASVFFGGDVCVGCSGTGTLDILDGAAVTSFTAAIADLPGSTGFAYINGPGSTWDIPFFLVVGNPAPLIGQPAASLMVTDGGTVNVGPGGILVLQNGQILGDGVINGNVTSIGGIVPGQSPGTLTINGEYQQVGQIPGYGSESGSLRMEIAGQLPGQYDQLAINGPARLGGGLFVDLLGGFEPPAGQPLDLPILSATGGLDEDTHFDVAFFPGITGDRFLNVTYPMARSGDIRLVVLPLPGRIDMQDPQQAGVPGVPNAVAVGDFDADGQDDLVVTVPGAAGQAGSAIVLLTRFQGDAYAPTATAYTMGIEPCGVAAGEFDGQPGIDIAVVNAGSNDVRVLTNTGTGVFNPVTLATTVDVGSEPRAITAADFDNDGQLDLAVANTGDSTVEILLNTSGTRSLFSPWTTLLYPGGVPGIFTVDPFDPDNDDDYDIGVTTVDGTVVVFANTIGATGNLGFDTPLNLPVGSGPVSLLGGQLDGVSGPELVATNLDDGTVSVLVNTSMGPDAVSFAPAVDLPARTNPLGSDPRSATLIDLDQDADLDIVVVARNDDDEVVARVLRNDLAAGQLAFAPAADLDAGPEPVAVTSGDLDGDDVADLIAINGSTGGGARSESVVVRLNAFAPTVPGDADGDGDVDLADLAALQQCFAEAPLPPACAVFDFDRDYDVDIHDFEFCCPAMTGPQP